MEQFMGEDLAQLKYRNNKFKIELASQTLHKRTSQCVYRTAGWGNWFAN